MSNKVKAALFKKDVGCSDKGHLLLWRRTFSISTFNRGNLLLTKAITRRLLVLQVSRQTPAATHNQWGKSYSLVISGCQMGANLSLDLCNGSLWGLIKLILALQLIFLSLTHNQIQCFVYCLKFKSTCLHLATWVISVCLYFFMQYIINALNCFLEVSNSGFFLKKYNKISTIWNHTLV